MDTNWEKVIKDSQLISLPEVYIKLQQLISTDDYSLNEIAEVISFDPAVTARLLRMVNSSFFGLASKIDTIGHAINYLGAQQVHDLVLSTSIAQTFSDMDNPAFNLHLFWQKSIYCAIAARELAVLCNVLDSERLFVTGLLHNIGHLMMRQSIPELIQQAEEQALIQQIPLYKSEQLLLGFDFSMVGVELLKKWNLPESLTETIKLQLEPSNAENYQLETAILHIAAALAGSFNQDLLIDEIIPQIDQHALNITSSNINQLISVDHVVQENLGTVISLLFPQLQVANF